MSDPTIISQDFETSAEIADFAKAFPKAQAAMGDVLKTATNPAFKSKYADLAAVVEATIPALNGAGFSVLQLPACSNGEVKVSTMILHESGQWMRCTLSLRPTKPDPQGVGSAITYGRRYGLQAMTGVAPEDDDGNAASRPSTPASNGHKPDLGPSTEGPDFWNCHDAGMSAYAAKKEGLDKVHDDLRHAASEIPNRPAIRQFIENNIDAVRRMPRSWRVELRQAVEARAEELGPDGNERRAA